MPIINMLPGGGGGARIPLEPCTDLVLLGLDSKVLVAWTDPENKYAAPGGELVSEWLYSVVVRKEGSAPISPIDGTLVVKSTIKNQYSENTFEDIGLQNGTTYYYAVYSYTTYGVVNKPIIGLITPMTKITYVGELENFYDNNGMIISGDYSGYASIYPAAASISGNAIFAGGYGGQYGTHANKNVNIYNESLTHIKGTYLDRVRINLCGVSTTKNAIFAAGLLDSTYVPIGSPYGSNICESYNETLTKNPDFSLIGTLAHRCQGAGVNDKAIIGGGARDNTFEGEFIQSVSLVNNELDVTSLTMLEQTHDSMPSTAVNVKELVLFLPSMSTLGKIEVYTYDGVKLPSVDISEINKEKITRTSLSGAVTVGDYAVCNSLSNYGNTNISQVYALGIDENLTCSFVDPISKVSVQRFTSSPHRGIIGCGLQRHPVSNNMPSGDIFTYNETLTLEEADKDWSDEIGRTGGAAAMAGDFIVFAGGLPYKGPTSNVTWPYASPKVYAFTN